MVADEVEVAPVVRIRSSVKSWVIFLRRFSAPFGRPGLPWPKRPLASRQAGRGEVGMLGVSEEAGAAPMENKNRTLGQEKVRHMRLRLGAPLPQRAEVN